MWLPIVLLFTGSTVRMLTAAYGSTSIPQYENKVESGCLYSTCIAPYLNKRYGSPDAFEKGCQTVEFELLNDHVATCDVTKKPCGGATSVKSVDALKDLGYLCGLIQAKQFGTGYGGQGGGNGAGGGGGGEGEGSGSSGGSNGAGQLLSKKGTTFAAIAMSEAIIAFALMM